MDLEKLLAYDTQIDVKNTYRVWRNGRFKSGNGPLLNCKELRLRTKDVTLSNPSQETPNQLLIQGSPESQPALLDQPGPLKSV